MSDDDLLLKQHQYSPSFTLIHINRKDLSNLRTQFKSSMMQLVRHLLLKPITFQLGSGKEKQARAQDEKEAVRAHPCGEEETRVPVQNCQTERGRQRLPEINRDGDAQTRTFFQRYFLNIPK